MAMIKVGEFLEKQNWYPEKARMLLTIHDELLLEIRDDIINEAQSAVREIMESVYKLEVPIKVDSHYGDNWAELKK